MSVSYKPLIKGMVWSYSRINSFKMCPYQFYLKYIRHKKDEPRFYASFGSFMHKLIEKFNKGERTNRELELEFLAGFRSNVLGERPPNNAVLDYIESGRKYLKDMEHFPFNTVYVERKMVFQIDDISFVGIIDYLGEKDGEYYIVDNKSKDLKPRCGKASDKVLDEMLEQLYLYSYPVKEKFGKYPKELCFNCFRNGNFIREPFDENRFHEVVSKTVETIHDIEEARSFEANINPFVCKWICGLSGQCSRYQENLEAWRRENL